MEISLKNLKEKLVKCATEVAHLHIGFLYKVVHKTAVSESSMPPGRFILTFLWLRLSL